MRGERHALPATGGPSVNVIELMPTTNPHAVTLFSLPNKEVVSTVRSTTKHLQS